MALCTLVAWCLVACVFDRLFHHQHHGLYALHPLDVSADYLAFDLMCARPAIPLDQSISAGLLLHTHICSVLPPVQSDHSACTYFDWVDSF